MSASTDLIERLNKAGIPLQHEAAKEIIRLRKIVDALTVKLNRELTDSYRLDERLTNAEHRMAKLFGLLQAIRMHQIGKQQ